MKKLFTLLVVVLIASLNVNAQSWSEDFESGTLPSGWTIESDATDGGWLFGSDLSSGAFPVPAHTNYAGTNDDACNCDKSNESLVTHSFDIPSVGVSVLSFEYFFVDGDYQGADETAKVLISTDAGTSWTELMDLPAVGEWTIQSIFLDNYAGETVLISFRYDDGGGWNYGFTIDDISVSELDDYNLVAEELITPEIYTTEDGGFPITCSFVNYGLLEVTDFTFHYQVDGGTEVTAEVTGLSIFSFGMAEVTHPTLLDVESVGNKTITAWVTNINQQGDVNSNEVSGVVQFTDQHSTRVGLSETFTSNTCGPCAGFNPPYQTELDALNTNVSGSNYVAIKYQVNWPSPGNDVCYNSDVDTRISYYNVTGVPNTFVESNDANYDFSFPATTWDEAAVNTALQFQDLTSAHGWVSINSTTTYNSDDNFLSVEVSLTPDANFDASSHKLYVAVINNYYDNTEINPSGTNGETDWNYVVRKMLPSGNGTTIGEMVTGEEMTFNFDYQFEVGNVTQGSFNLVNEDINVVVWIQDSDSKQIRNTNLSDMVSGINEESTNVSNFKIYPNPANNVAHVSMNLLESNTIRVEIINLLGKVIYTEDMGQLPAGNHLFDVDAAAIGSGMYLFNIYVGEQSVTERVSIN